MLSTSSVTQHRHEPQTLTPIILSPPHVTPPIMQQQHGGKRRRLTKVTERTNKYIKQVRFAQTDRTYEDVYGTSGTSEPTWFSKKELDIFRSRGKSLALEISNNPHMKDSPSSYRNVLESTYRRAMLMEEGQDEVTDNKGLWVWIQHGHSRRGLERWSVPSVGIHRQERRNAYVHRVMILQKQSILDKELALRQLSEHYSNPSRVLARSMGAADAHAAMEFTIETGSEGEQSNAATTNNYIVTL